MKICYSGGAVGADTVFEEMCILNDIKVIAWGFKGHKTNSLNNKILSQDELDKGFEHVKIANKSLKRNIYNISPYVKNLLSRNWYQVLYSDAIYAIANMNNDYMTVAGGTGWCVMMGVDNRKQVYVFDQKSELWYEYDYVIGFKPMNIDTIPLLTEKFAGVGSRELTDSGVLAIKKLFTINEKAI
jgi:hypothetical protein